MVTATKFTTGLAPLHLRALRSTFYVTDGVDSKKIHWYPLIIQPCHPVSVNLLRAICYRVGSREGVSCFRKLKPRHPLQKIPIGDCTQLLGDFGVFIFLVRKVVTRPITILPLCIFFLRKNRHTLYLIWRSPIIICLNQLFGEFFKLRQINFLCTY